MTISEADVAAVRERIADQEAALSAKPQGGPLIDQIGWIGPSARAEMAKRRRREASAARALPTARHRGRPQRVPDDQLWIRRGALVSLLELWWPWIGPQLIAIPTLKEADIANLLRRPMLAYNAPNPDPEAAFPAIDGLQPPGATGGWELNFLAEFAVPLSEFLGSGELSRRPKIGTLKAALAGSWGRPGGKINRRLAERQQAAANRMPYRQIANAMAGIVDLNRLLDWRRERRIVESIACPRCGAKQGALCPVQLHPERERQFTAKTAADKNIVDRVRCPQCGAESGERCKARLHSRRRDAYASSFQQSAPPERFPAIGWKQSLERCAKICWPPIPVGLSAQIWSHSFYRIPVRALGASKGAGKMPSQKRRN